ncbi:MAG: MGMT family protein [Candidatus Omnitrophota bacterium]|nr:MGMT family protein [Candidatus Omnitrophota bacterium]
MKRTNKKLNSIEKAFLNADIRKSNADKRRFICDHPRAICENLRSRRTSLSFQDRVLKVVSKIPLGQVRSYAWVAKKIGQPKAVRAVGQALNKNPYPLIIPCHRVINSNGSLGGYARGRKIKANLLHLEQALAGKMQAEQ